MCAGYGVVFNMFNTCCPERRAHSALVYFRRVLIEGIIVLDDRLIPIRLRLDP